MIMSYIWTGFILFSILSALLTGQGAALAAAVPSGAQAGITLSIALAGSICLWTGAGRLMQECGITNALTKFLSPVLYRLFPETKKDPTLAGHVSANITANLLGLGNAATPMGIQAAKTLASGNSVAGESLCRLMVLNSASIQLIPTNVAAIRASLGCVSPFDILPAVWITSFSSAAVGLLVGKLLEGIWKK